MSDSLEKRWKRDEILQKIMILLYFLSSVCLYILGYWGLDDLLGGHSSFLSFEFFLCAFILGIIFIIPFNILIFYPLALYGCYTLPNYNWVFTGIVSYRFVLLILGFIGLYIKSKEMDTIIEKKVEIENKYLEEENINADQFIKDMIDDVKKYVGVHPTPPEDLLNLVSLCNYFVSEMVNRGEIIVDIEKLNLVDAKSKILFTHIFSKYPNKPSKQSQEFADKGVYIQEHIDYEENITVQEFYDKINDDKFFLMDKDRTRNIDMDLFNKYITPIIEELLFDSLE